MGRSRPKILWCGHGRTGRTGSYAYVYGNKNIAGNFPTIRYFDNVCIAIDVVSIKISVQLPGSPHCSSSTVEASYVMIVVAVNSGT